MKNKEIFASVSKDNLVDCEVICFDNDGFYVLEPVFPVSKTVFRCRVKREFDSGDNYLLDFNCPH